jgi:magnesium-transporting ATPase (P-type)
LIPYLVFSLFSVPLALTPIQILSIDMGTDSLTALGLRVEKPDPRMMRRPPARSISGSSIGPWRCVPTCSWAQSKP